MKKSIVSFAGAVVLWGGVSGAGADVVLEWNEQVLQTIRQNGDFELSSPGWVSRYAAIVFVSMYDAVNSIARTHEPFVGFEECPAGTSKEAAAATAAYRALTQMFQLPVDLAQFNALYAAQMAAIPDGPEKLAGVALGMACADACLAARMGDGSTDYVEYVSGVGPGHWVPTFPDYTGPWGPHWAAVTPWCMTSGDQFRPATGPFGYSDMTSLLASPEWAADYEDVLTNGAIFSLTRTEDETIAAIYWANDRNGTFKPPGHLLHITQVIAEDRGNTLEENARLFALVALGMADAGIAAWDAKYATDIDLWRPITAIWAGDDDGNPATVGDPSWLGLSYDPAYLIFTPPFPAWVSGHATFGAVHAAIVRNFYGTDAITFTATSDDTPGYWRTFHSLEAAARENGRSRIWLGVHYQVDVDDGFDMGTAIGDYVSSGFLRRLGDLDGNGLVDGADLGLLLGAWGSKDPAADLDRDGTVTGADLGILLGNWG
ncbi:MAG TPA: phosphatase PAP2 family protein [Phycisphaerales bacterium]|nr:phosphatase PAP2 family protein [Phycisphaerales bacterium]HMP37467.1 phosphatase PAP2 family protein [Phycisphaerales bacterium]